MVSIEDLRRAHGIVAELAMREPKFIPIFERVDRELETRTKPSKLERIANRARDLRDLC